jgi:hypothetical protein
MVLVGNQSFNDARNLGVLAKSLAYLSDGLGRIGTTLSGPRWLRAIAFVVGRPNRLSAVFGFGEVLDPGDRVVGEVGRGQRIICALLGRWTVVGTRFATA